MKKSNKLCCFLLASALSGQVFAQATNVTVKEKKSGVLQKLLPDSISHFSIFNGPSLELNSRPNEFDGTDEKDGISSWHQVSFRYHLTDRTKLVINPRFTVDYNIPDDSGQFTKTQAQADNPVFGINSTWVKAGNFTWSGSVNTVFWLFDEADKKNQLLLNPGGFQTLNYKINPKVSVGSWVWGRYRVFMNNDQKDKLPIFLAPYVSYNFTDNIGMMTFYQFNGEIPRVNKINWDQDDHANLLFSFKINKYLNLQPMMTLFREQNFRIKDGNLNLWVSGRFF